MAVQYNFLAQHFLGVFFRIPWGSLQLGKRPKEVAAASPGKQRAEEVQVLQQLTKTRPRAKLLKYCKWQNTVLLSLISQLCENTFQSTHMLHRTK